MTGGWCSLEEWLELMEEDGVVLNKNSSVSELVSELATGVVEVLAGAL